MVSYFVNISLFSQLGKFFREALRRTGRETSLFCGIITVIRSPVVPLSRLPLSPLKRQQFALSHDNLFAVIAAPELGAISLLTYIEFFFFTEF